MKIFVVTTDREETQIHNVSVKEGKYLRPRNVAGTFAERAEKILSYILLERPDKVVIEEAAFGKGVLDSLTVLMDRYHYSLEKDGTVRY